MNGRSTYELTVGSIYNEPTKPVTVMLDGEDITDDGDVDIDLTVTDATETPISNYGTVVGKTVGTYTFTYTVTYQGEVVTTLTRTVVVSEG